MKQDFLKERADNFFNNAIDLIKKGIYDLATFNFEQSSQLYVKHFLFTKIKDFPRIHSIKELLEEVKKVYEVPSKIDEFTKNREKIIADLEEAYLTSRYLPASFFREDAEAMRKFVGDLKKLLFGNE